MSNHEYFEFAWKIAKNEVGSIKRKYYALATMVHMDLDVDARMELIRQFTESTNTILDMIEGMKETGIGISNVVDTVHDFCEKHSESNNNIGLGTDDDDDNEEEENE